MLAVAAAAVLSSQPAFAQSGRSVTGTIVGPDGQPMSGAMVVALAMPDSVLTQWATTGGDGAFRVGPLASGDYLLQVTLIGHQTVRNPVTIGDADVAAGTIGLEILAVEVDQLVITVDHVPFLNQRDTLAYNALAFQTRPNATVEDLLKRLPGVEVDGDGTITAQGEEVENVLVDGKEFFGTDPTVATQNLRADAIERVEIYDRQSDMAEFTGIADGGEQRTINLALREEARNGYFGQASGGAGADIGEYGTDLPIDFGGPPTDRVPYAGAFNLNRFSPTTQLAVIANANNVNQQGFGRVSLVDGGGGRGGGGGGNGFTESLAAGLNGSQEFGEDTWLRASYFLNRRENIQNSASEEQRLLGSEVASVIQRIGEDETENWNHRLNLNSQIEFTEGHDLRIRGNLSAGSQNRTATDLQSQTVMGDDLNSALTNNIVNGNDFGADGRLTWRKRLSEEGRSLVAEGRLDYGDSDRATDLTSTVEGDPRFGRDIIQEQNVAGKTLSHSIRVSLTEPFSGGRVLEVFGQRNAIEEDQAQTVFDIENDSPVFNPVLSSEFDRLYTYLRGGFRYSRNTRDVRWVIGAQVQNSDLNGKVLDPELEVEPISAGFTHVLPRADVRFQLDEGKTFEIEYNTSTREPSMSQFQPFADNTDPLNIYVGNPNLEPEYRHRFSTQYRTFDNFSFVNFFTYANVNLTANNIADSRFVDAEGRQVFTPVNAGGSWSANGGANFGTPIRPIKARISVDYRLSYNSESAFVNDAENESRRWQNAFNLRLENRNKDRFDIAAGGGLAFNDINYSLNQELNQNYLSGSMFAEGSYYLGSWTFESDLNFRGYDEQVFGPDLNVTMWNASITKLIMNDRGELQLGAYDLLNQNQGVSVLNTASFNRTERTQTIGRYVMLRFVYHLGSQGMGGRERGFGRRR
jgi:hypothetical protein